jgi:hypothetical protein
LGLHSEVAAREDKAWGDVYELSVHCDLDAQVQVCGQLIAALSDKVCGENRRWRYLIFSVSKKLFIKETLSHLSGRS